MKGSKLKRPAKKKSQLRNRVAEPAAGDEKPARSKKWGGA